MHAWVQWVGDCTQAGARIWLGFLVSTLIDGDGVHLGLKCYNHGAGQCDAWVLLVELDSLAVTSGFWRGGGRGVFIHCCRSALLLALSTLA